MQFIKNIGLLAPVISLSLFISSCLEKDVDDSITDGETTTITLLQTADIHAQLMQHDEFFWVNEQPVFNRRGGFAHIKTLVEQVKSENPATLLVDGGDLIQGGGASVMSQGRIFPDIVRAMKYDVMIPGNWEVVYGKESMMEVLNGFNSNIIAANIYHQGSEQHVFKPYHVEEVNGIRIGFLGYNDPDVPVRQNPTFSVGLDFRPVEDNLQEMIKTLKEDEKVDILILMAHMGISRQVSLGDNTEVEGVDFIFGNDTHERIREPIQRAYAMITEPGAFGSFVGRLDLHIRDGQLIDHDYELMEVDPELFPADAEMEQIVDNARAPYRSALEEVLGYTQTPLYRYLIVENPMDNMITDALRWKTGVDIAISNGFRFSPPLVPAEGGQTAITKEYLWSMLPVNEPVKTARARGQQIRQWLEKEMHNVFAQNPDERFGGWLVRFSGMRVRFDSSKPEGERLIEVMIKGEPLQDDRIYTLAACRRPGDPEDRLCRMPGVLEPEVLSYTIHEAIEDYLAAEGTVAPVTDGRALAVDLGPNALSQMPGTSYEFR